MLNQQFANAFKASYGFLILIKLLISCLFIFSFTWAYELTEINAKAANGTEEEKDDAQFLKLCFITSGITFAAMRLIEFIMFILIRNWAGNRVNFNFHNKDALMEYDDNKLNNYLKKLSTKDIIDYDEEALNN